MGFQVLLIYCDGVYKFFLNPVKDKYWQEFSNPGDHVPETEEE